MKLLQSSISGCCILSRLRTSPHASTHKASPCESPTHPSQVHKNNKIAGRHAKVLTGNQNMNAYLMKYVQPQPFFVQEDK